MWKVIPYDAAAEAAVVEFSLRAWAPVFDSTHRELGESVFGAMYPDWRGQQADAVRAALSDQAHTSWLAVEGARPIGFVSVALHRDALPESTLGEIFMIAVDPDHQGRGVGHRLTHVALAWFRNQGVTIAAVETGGDPGHAPARALYERAGFGLLPIARYFQALTPTHAEAEGTAVDGA